MAKASCDSCVYNVYDEDDETYYCEVDMDEDDAARLMQGHYRECPYYQLDDEYAVVRHQIKKEKGCLFSMLLTDTHPFLVYSQKICSADKGNFGGYAVRS